MAAIITEALDSHGGHDTAVHDTPVPQYKCPTSNMK